MNESGAFRGQACERRRVRATTDFFQDLDRQLPAERQPDGQPSRADFQAYELFSILDRFATGFAICPSSSQAARNTAS